jgi:TRAP-type mannitol/chloroaromatic compound transport system permease large subunit
MPGRIYPLITREILIAVPLFVFMGVMLEKSRIAEDLLENMGTLFGPMRGGLGISVIFVGALLAASTGIVGATVVTMGLLSLPTMLNKGYAPSLASASIAASGTLGQIIPPSIVLVILADQISNAFQEAQRSYDLDTDKIISVGDLFAGALLPGFILVAAYALYIFAVAVLKPADAPAQDWPEGADAKALLWQSFRSMLPPIFLIIAVLGSILSGYATPTRGAALGALGAILLACYKLEEVGPVKNPINQFIKFISALLLFSFIISKLIPVPTGLFIMIVLLIMCCVTLVFIYKIKSPKTQLRVLRGISLFAALSLTSLILLDLSGVDLRLSQSDWTGAERLSIFLGAGFVLVGVVLTIISTLQLGFSGILGEVSRSTLHITAMVFVILIGATVFSLVFRGLGGDEMVARMLEHAPGGPTGAFILVMVMMFILGFFLDFIEITFVVVPLVAPPLLATGMDPVWLGIVMALNLQTSFLTPPFGFALFYLRGVAPPEVTTTALYKGVLPFIAIQIAIIGLVIAFPGLATAIPESLQN